MTRLSLNTGSLDQRFTVERRKVAQDDIQSAAAVWETVATFWAAVRTKATVESENAQQLRQIKTVLVTTHYSSQTRTIETGMRLVSQSGKQFNIIGVENVEERNEWIRLTCQEKS